MYDNFFYKKQVVLKTKVTYLKIPSRNIDDFVNGFDEVIVKDLNKQTYSFVGLSALVSMTVIPKSVYVQVGCI